jgi:aldose 1-epimerase
MRPTLAGLAVLSAITITDMNAATTVKRSDFGKMPDGTAVSLYTLTNVKGMEARIMTYGGILVSLKVPDRKGAPGDVVLGHDALSGYLSDPPMTFFGALIGRYANRIGHAQFALEGVTYKLIRNDGENSLHGGPNGFDKRIWTAREVPGGVELTYLSKDGEEHYPGNLKAVVTYRLTDDNRLQIHYAATTDKPTVVNLTNHSYWNLKGDGDILNHLVTLNADRFTPVDAGLIPTGELKSVAGTPFDFRKATAPGARIGQADAQLKLGHGYDHNWILNRTGSGPSLAARVEETSTGRVMEVYTDQPGIQFYTGNFLDGKSKARGGRMATQHAALCLETQHFPDTPNKPSFPSAELKPGERYETTTEFRFTTK